MRYCLWYSVVLEKPYGLMFLAWVYSIFTSYNSDYKATSIVPLSLLHQGCGTVCLPISEASPLFFSFKKDLKTYLFKDGQQRWCAYESIGFRRNINASYSNKNICHKCTRTIITYFQHIKTSISNTPVDWIPFTWGCYRAAQWTLYMPGMEWTCIPVMLGVDGPTWLTFYSYMLLQELKNTHIFTS